MQENKKNRLKDLHLWEVRFIALRGIIGYID